MTQEIAFIQDFLKHVQVASDRVCQIQNALEKNQDLPTHEHLKKEFGIITGALEFFSSIVSERVKILQEKIDTNSAEENETRFVHDLSNKLAIALGTSEQMEDKLVRRPEKVTPEYLNRRVNVLKENLDTISNLASKRTKDVVEGG